MHPQNEVQPEPDEIDQPEPKRLRVWIGIAALVLILGAAAYIGGRFLNPQARNGWDFGVQGGPNVVKVSQDDKIPAKELPAGEPDVNGIFLRRVDNSLFMGTGLTSFGISEDENGLAAVETDYNGSEVEVVLTNETQVYRDLTGDEPGELAPEGEQFQQVVTEGSAEEVGEHSALTVWGRKAGDRYIADVLVYTLPPVLNAPLKNQ